MASSVTKPSMAPWANFTFHGALLGLLLHRGFLARIRHFRRHPTPTERAIVVGLSAWTVTALLCVVNGPAAFSAFLHDLATQARLLIAIPLLLQLDGTVSDVIRDGFRRMAMLVPPELRPRYDGMVRDARAWFEDWRVEAALLLVACMLLLFGGGGGLSQEPQSWELRGRTGFSAAGLFHGLFILPLFFFCVLRWSFRYVVWLVFLLRARRLPLNLVAIHPDHAGGLGFVGRTQLWFGAVLVGLEWVASARAAALVLWQKAEPQEFTMSLLVMLVAATALFAFPSALFTRHLWKLRFGSVAEFDSFTTQTARKFEDNWMSPDEPPEPERLRSVLQTGDIQSLADLHGSFESVHKTRISPMALSEFLQLMVLVVLPAALPLAASVPLSQVLQSVFKAVF